MSGSNDIFSFTFLIAAFSLPNFCLSDEFKCKASTTCTSFGGCKASSPDAKWIPHKVENGNVYMYTSEWESLGRAQVINDSIRSETEVGNVSKSFYMDGSGKYEYGLTNGRANFLFKGVCDGE